MKILANSKNLFGQTKKGAASIYVVVFATILFGVITLSFVSVILSEAGQSSDDDLSRSAYDAALAGVEDAKQAIIEYDKRCKAGSSDPYCGSVGGAGGTIKADGCMDMAKFVYSNTNLEGEVLISEGTGTEGESLDQAYTCVTMSSEADDFKATLDSSTPTMIVPIGKNSTGGIAEIETIEFNWFSPVNLKNGKKHDNLNNNGKFNQSSSSPVPSALTLTLIVAPSSVDLSSFENSDYIGQSVMVLLPSDSGTKNEIDSNDIRNAALASQQDPNQPFKINCDEKNTDYACKVTLQVKDYFAANTGAANAFLIVSNTYNDGLDNDFSVALKNGGKTVKFNGAQVTVDSTGRANQLVRRVEARIDPADLGFPVPEYALQFGGEGDDALSKAFYITNNCWTENGGCPNNNNKKGN